MMVLQVFNIRKEYQGAPVLTDVSFHLAGGERVGLVGANGCGKSTLMKILAGQLPASGGTLHWVTDGLSRAYLSQEEHFDPELPLLDQLGAVPADLLAKAGITPALLGQRAGSLSGGQKTRAALARALAGRPDLLMVDEPTNHLDTDGLQWLEALLTSYRGTVLVVSHDRYFLDRVATRMLEMEGGKVKEYPGNYSAYAARWLFRDAGFYVQRGDRVAVVGPNGSGKSTLVRLILGELAPGEGTLYRSPVRVAYLAQEMEHLNPATTVLQEATGNSAMDQAAARTLLGCLLFSGEAVLKRVGALSGGEKVRLALAKILLSAPDLLVLDEPTNGLDLPSRAANRVLWVERGRLELFEGSYQAFQERGQAPAETSLADRRLLLETRLARLSALLAAPPAGEAERLNQEFIQLSRELRALTASPGKSMT